MKLAKIVIFSELPTVGVKEDCKKGKLGIEEENH
jgi:hypothetical protein